MTDKEKLVAKYLLNDISEYIVGMPYSRTDKPEHEVINEAVSTKVIPLLSESERMKLVGKGAEAKTRLWVYETMKSWKLPNKAPGTAEMRLILAKYYGYTDWKSCLNHYLPIAQEVKPDVTADKRSFRIPFISINFRSLMYVVVTIFIGIIAFTLFKMEQLFSRMADDRPAIPRQIEKTAPGPILISNDSIGSIDYEGEGIVYTEKDLRVDQEEEQKESRQAMTKEIVPRKTPVKKVSPRKAVLELGLSWDAKSLAESMSRGDLEAISLFVQGEFPLQSDYKGASVLLYAYEANAIDPVGVTDKLIELGFDFRELLVDRSLIRQTSPDLPVSFQDERLPKYDSYQKTFQGSLVMWLTQMVIWRGEKNHEVEVIKKLVTEWDFEIAPKFIYQAQVNYGVPVPEIANLFKEELIEAKRAAFDLNRSLDLMRYWPNEYEIDGQIFHPIVPRDKQHIYVQKKGNFEISVRPIDAGDFVDRLQDNFMKGENINRFQKELDTYGIGRNSFDGFGDKYAFVFLEVESEESVSLYKLIQPNYVNISTKMILVCKPNETGFIDFLKKQEVGGYDAATILTTGNKEAYYLNLYADQWTGGPRVVVTKRNGQILKQYDSVDGFKNFLIEDMR
ncbi:MAG: hypothetical protein R8G66_08575 [Cytophagales bacterium]|nr:hypothetical protein [Cytophagales bacterium]